MSRKVVLMALNYHLLIYLILFDQIVILKQKQDKPKRLFFTKRRKWAEWTHTHTNTLRQKGFCGRKGASTVLKVSHDSEENMLWEELYSVMTAKNCTIFVYD